MTQSMGDVVGLFRRDAALSSVELERLRATCACSAWGLEPASARLPASRSARLVDHAGQGKSIGSGDGESGVQQVMGCDVTVAAPVRPDSSS